MTLFPRAMGCAACVSTSVALIRPLASILFYFTSNWHTGALHTHFPSTFKGGSVTAGGENMSCLPASFRFFKPRWREGFAWSSGVLCFLVVCVQVAAFSLQLPLRDSMARGNAVRYSSCMFGDVDGPVNCSLAALTMVLYNWK